MNELMNELTKEDCRNLIIILNKTTFTGSEIEAAYLLKQKLLRIAGTLNNKPKKEKENE